MGWGGGVWCKLITHCWDLWLIECCYALLLTSRKEREQTKILNYRWTWCWYIFNMILVLMMRRRVTALAIVVTKTCSSVHYSNTYSLQRAVCRNLEPQSWPMMSVYKCSWSIWRSWQCPPPLDGTMTTAPLLSLSADTTTCTACSQPSSVSTAITAVFFGFLFAFEDKDIVHATDIFLPYIFTFACDSVMQCLLN